MVARKDSAISKNTIIRYVVLLSVLWVAVAGCGPKGGGPPGGGRPPDIAPVRVAEVTVQPVQVQLRNVGRVEAYAAIDVRARIPGELTKVWFSEGDSVEEGQTLFTIDPRPYEVAAREAQARLDQAKAQVEQAQASRVRDAAQAESARLELVRNESLFPKGMVSQEELEKVRAASEALRASVVADEATVKSSEQNVRVAEAVLEDANLDLEYCTIRSPIRGRTGRLLVNQGNLVRATDAAALVVINQIQPIYVTFSLPERYLDQLRRRFAKGNAAVTAAIPGSEDAPISGSLTFIDNEVAKETGTIRLKAAFPNQDERLWPEQYVQAAVQVAELPNAVVAPAQAVQTGQEGTFVFVVMPGNTVTLRRVKVGDTIDGLAVIEEGLESGEQVVVDGQLRLKDGAQISIASAETPAGETAR